MQKYIDTFSILSEARMMKKDYNETYILVEGESDKTFFKTLTSFSPNIRFRPVNGWEKVYGVICAAQQEKYMEILGVIDRDYHLLINDGITESEQLIFSDDNDIEMMIFLSSSFDKFLTVCATKTKMTSLTAKPRTLVLSTASSIGALRAISLLKKYCFHFEGLNLKEFIDKDTLAPNCTLLIEKVIQRTRSRGIQVSKSLEELVSEHQDFMKSNNTSLLCNGHDVLDILGIAMCKMFASATANQYNGDNLFDYLLVGYPSEEFQQSGLYKKMADWIDKHATQEN